MLFSTFVENVLHFERSVLPVFFTQELLLRSQATLVYLSFFHAMVLAQRRRKQQHLEVEASKPAISSLANRAQTAEQMVSAAMLVQKFALSHLFRSANPVSKRAQIT